MIMHALMLAAAPSQGFATTPDASAGTPAWALATWLAAILFLVYVVVSTYREASHDNPRKGKSAPRASEGDTQPTLPQHPH